MFKSKIFKRINLYNVLLIYFSIFIFLFIFQIIFPSLCFSQKVQFAGFSFSGDFSENTTRYPFASKFIQEVDSRGVNLLDAALSKQLQKLKRADLVLNTDLVTTSSGDSLALAFALTVENVEVVKWGCRYLNLYKVLGQILVFDFEEKKVIANFPSMVQHQDFSETPRSYEVHSAVFRKIWSFRKLCG